MSGGSDPEPASLELARRLLGHVSFGPKVELVLGGLPAHLVDELPLPAGASLLGSALETWDTRRPILQAVFDAPGDSAAVLDAYQHQLRGQGWEVFESPGPPHGGFLPGRASRGMNMRRPGTGPVLRAAAAQGEAQNADLRVTLDWEMPHQMKEWGAHQRPPGMERMPALYPPTGVTVHPQGGGGGGGGRWYQAAVAYTESATADLEGQFALQLEAAGWTRLDGRAEDVVAWSSWRLSGSEEWRGLLLVMALFGTARRSLWLGIEAIEPEDDDGYHVSSVAHG